MKGEIGRLRGFAEASSEWGGRAEYGRESRDRRERGPAGGWRDGRPPAGEAPGAGRTVASRGQVAGSDEPAGAGYRRYGPSRVRSAGDRRSRAVLAWCQYG
jgi:hypothetical protein